MLGIIILSSRYRVLNETNEVVWNITTSALNSEHGRFCVKDIVGSVVVEERDTDIDPGTCMPPGT